MKLKILILSILISSISFSQERKRLVLKEDGWFTISLGTTVLSSFTYIEAKHGKDSDVEKEVRYGGLAFAGTIGITLHIISWERKPIYNPRLRTSKML